MPGNAKAESDECPKIQALRARLKRKQGDTFFSGKPVFPPLVCGLFGEAKIRLKRDPVYRHREFAIRGEERGHGENPQEVHPPGLVRVL